MPLPILAIASGAIKVGQKLFAGIRNRKAKKAAKKQAKADASAAGVAALDAKLASLGFGQQDTGATPITQSGNTLAMLLGQKEDEQPDSIAVEVDKFAFLKSPIGMVAAGFALFLIAKALKIIK